MSQVTSSSGDEVEVESIVIENFTYSRDISRAELAKMIVLHEYPLSMVEHIDFKWFCRKLQPLWKPITRDSIKSEIINLYEMERMKTAELFAKIPSRIAITTNMWTASTQNKGYMSVTAHFIDDNWILQSRLIRFIYVPSPHSAESLCHLLVDCLFDWNLDRKVSTFIVDSTNDAMIERVFEKIPTSSFLMQGSLFHMRCCVRILNLIAKESLSTIEYSVQKIRDSVAYWIATPKREEKFADACRQLNMTYSKKLALDCRTRWNSTYIMIASALPYQQVFGHLKVREREYKFVPSEDNWIMATEICDKLKLFYNVTKLFSGTQYLTANEYFLKICKIRLALGEWFKSENLIIKNMAADMITKFDKYWGLIRGVMVVVAVLDPRFKMKILKYFFPLIYGSESDVEMRKVRKLLEDLMSEYEARDMNRSNLLASNDFTSSNVTTDSLSRKDKWQ